VSAFDPLRTLACWAKNPQRRAMATMRHASTLLLAAGTLLASCVTDEGPGSVSNLLAQRQAVDGQVVTVRGILSARHGLLNLYSRDRQQCVGLLVTDADRLRYAGLDGRPVQATGRMMAEGCGRNGICDERLCGPAVLRDIQVQPH
jgi:hypothetical protein